MKKRSIVTLVVVFGALFLGLIVFVGVIVAVFGDSFDASEPAIGVVEVEDTIVESQEIIEDIERWEDDDSIEAVLVRIDSPGGAPAPSQEIFQAIQRVKEEKPVAVSMGSLAASGGYYAACGADQIYANGATMTGSIGVITQFFNVGELTERIDVEVHTVSTGEFKDSGSPFEPFEEEDEQYFSQMIFDVHEQFVEDVANSREMEVEDVEEYADGRAFTGRQAQQMGLVDEVGTMQDATDYLADEAGLDDPELRYPPEEQLGVFGEMFETAVESSANEVRNQQRPRVSYEYVGPQ